ncbi:MAG: phenylacetate--CoA ligase family protein [Candidatus Hodarchaeota archaeon]
MPLMDQIVVKVINYMSRERSILKKIRKTVRRAYQSRYYQEKLDALEVKPAHIRSFEDFQEKIPITYRNDISLKARSPFDLLALDYRKETMIYGQTSGTTTGEAVPVIMTKRELESSIKIALKLPVFRAYIGPGDKVALVFPYTRTFAGRTADLMAQFSKTLVVPIGTRTNIFPPAQVVGTLLAIRPTILGVIPTDAFALAQILRDRGMDPKDLGVKQIVMGAEPCSKNRAELIRQMYEAENVFTFVGQNEVGLPGIPCLKGNLHLPTVAMYAELYTEDGEPTNEYGVPVVPVITPLFRKAMPVLRYWTDDLVILEKNCPCGLKMPIYNILGRTLTKVDLPNFERKGPLMPTDLENILFEDKIYGVWYQFHIYEDHLKIIVEHNDKTEFDQLAASISKRFEKKMQMPCECEMVPLKTLYDYYEIRPGKPLSRVIDHRQSEGAQIIEGA